MTHKRDRFLVEIDRIMDASIQEFRNDMKEIGTPAMTHDELENEIAKAISGAPFTTPRSLTKAQAVLAAIREAGFAIVPVAPTEAMLRAGIAEYDGGGLANDIWDAMIKAAQEVTP